eukprot:6433-Heterococcus_DN1.PRE.4
MSEAMTATVTEFCLLLFTSQCCCATGFINYFGTQRVGSVQLDAVMPHSIGKAILQGNLAAAVKQILQPLQPSQLQSGSGSSSATAATATAAVATATAAAGTIAASLQSCNQTFAESTPDVTEASDAHTDSCTNSSSSSNSDNGSTTQSETSSNTTADSQAQQQQQQQAQYVQPQPTAAVALLWDYLEGRCTAKSCLKKLNSKRGFSREKAILQVSSTTLSCLPSNS